MSKFTNITSVDGSGDFDRDKAVPRKTVSMLNNPGKDSKPSTPKKSIQHHRSRPVPETDDYSNIEPKRPPPPSFVHPKSLKYADHLRFFRQLEKWLNESVKVYVLNPEEIYKDAEILTVVIREIMECASRMYDLPDETFFKDRIDIRLWAAAFYDLITILRRIRRSSPDYLAPKIMNMTIKYYEQLLAVLAKDHVIKLHLILKGKAYFEDTLDVPELEYESQWNNDKDNRLEWELEKCLLNSPILEIMYRICIYIGDAGRYGSKLHPFFLEKSVQYYNAARMFDVNKGRSFYQMGVLCLSREDYVKAMYNFLRASEAECPISEGHFQVQEVYDVAFKRHLKIKSHLWYLVSRRTEYANKNKHEVWLYSNKLGRIPPTIITPSTKQDHTASLTFRELYFRFSLTYVLVWGKIYCNIGLDDINQVAEECLVYFEGLLQEKNTGVLSVEEFARIVYLGLRVSEKYLESRTPPMPISKAQKRQCAEDATFIIQFVQELFSIALERLLKLLRVYDFENPACDFLSACVILWFQWLKKHDDKWEKQNCPRPIFSVRHLEKSKDVNKKDKRDGRWTIFAEIQNLLVYWCNTCRDRTNPFPKLIMSSNKEQRDRCYEVTFPEMDALRGVVNTIPVNNIYGKSITRRLVEHEHQLPLARLSIRLHEIQNFGHWMLYERPNLLKCIPLVNTTDIEVYTSVAKFRSPKSDSDICGLDDNSYLYWINDSAHVPYYYKTNEGMKVATGDCNSARIFIRTKTQDSKSNMTRLNDYPDKWRKLKERGFRVNMIINPTNMVIDTNCFINRFEWVEKFIKCALEPILIPVTVVLELKGLSKGGLNKKLREKFDNQGTDEAQEKLQEANEIAARCKLALDFINKNTSCFRIVNTSGKIWKISNINDRVEDDDYDPKQRNDNRILDTCIRLEELNTFNLKKNTPVTLHRNTVLVTNDRGLRVKSSVNDIPTREIESIVEWLWEYRKQTILCLKEKSKPKQSWKKEDR